jgi:hypothetical protein
MAHGISRGVLKLVRISTLIKKKKVIKKKGYKKVIKGYPRMDIKGLIILLNPNIKVLNYLN